jgi:hypothetical protein
MATLIILIKVPLAVFQSPIRERAGESHLSFPSPHAVTGGGGGWYHGRAETHQFLEETSNFLHTVGYITAWRESMELQNLFPKGFFIGCTLYIFFELTLILEREVPLYGDV